MPCAPNSHGTISWQKCGSALRSPEDVYLGLMDIARQEQRSRKNVVLEAMSSFLRKREGDEITRQLNEAYADDPLDDDDRRMLDVAAFDMAERLNDEDGGWPQ